MHVCVFNHKEAFLLLNSQKPFPSNLRQHSYRREGYTLFSMCYGNTCVMPSWRTGLCFPIDSLKSPDQAKTFITSLGSDLKSFPEVVLKFLLAVS